MIKAIGFRPLIITRTFLKFLPFVTGWFPAVDIVDVFALRLIELTVVESVWLEATCDSPPLSTPIGGEEIVTGGSLGAPPPALSADTG